MKPSFAGQPRVAHPFDLAITAQIASFNQMANGNDKTSDYFLLAAMKQWIEHFYGVEYAEHSIPCLGVKYLSSSHQKCSINQN